MKHFFGFRCFSVVCFFSVFLVSSMFALICRANETVHINIFEFDEKNKKTVFKKRFKVSIAVKDSIEITQEIPGTLPRFDRGVGTIKRYLLKDRYQTPGSGQCGTVSSYGLSSFIEWEEQYYRAIYFKFVPDSSSGGASGGVFKVMSSVDPNLVMKNFPAAHPPDDFIKVSVDATRNFSVLSKKSIIKHDSGFFCTCETTLGRGFSGCRAGSKL